MNQGARNANYESTAAGQARREVQMLDLLTSILAKLDAKPHGCICPVGAERTCGGFMCPRRTIVV